MNEKNLIFPDKGLLRELGYRIEHVGEMVTDGYSYMRLYHQKSGGRVTLTDRVDNYMTFAVIFKTPPTDDTGVFHILEHSVLCGSEKFPVKDPFTEVMKSSLNVYMNAFTAPDRTYYPFTTPSEKDYFGLAEVYLDAVFCPLAMKNESIFMQEGHRVEIGEDGEPRRTGVVFNEMAGDYAGASSFADYEICRMLYPGGSYSYDSGGHPDHIGELTYEGFKKAYEEHYRPDNCMVYADGSVDHERLLRLVGSYFDGYTARGVLPEISMGGDPVTYDPERDTLTEMPFPAVEGDGSRPTVYICWRGAPYSRVEENLALSLAVSTIAEHNGSQLKEAVLATGLCTNMELTCSTESAESSTECELEGVEPKNAPALIKALLGAIADICRQGIRREDLEATLKHAEFITRMGDSGSTPRGIVNLNHFSQGFVMDMEPSRIGNLDLIFERLWEMVRSGKCERLLEARVLKAPMSALIAIPDEDMNRRRTEEEQRRMAEQFPAGSEARRQLTERLAAFELWQSLPDSEEALDSMPTLTKEDIGQMKPPTVTDLEIAGGVPIMHHRIHTSGITYTELYFDLSDLKTEELPLPSLFTMLRGDLPTASGSATDFKNKIKSSIGSLYITLTTLKQGKEPRLYLVVRASALENDTDKIAELIGEALYTVDFSRTELTRRRIEQYVIGLPSLLEGYCSDYLTTRALGMFDRSEALKDRATGLTVTEELKRLGYADDEALARLGSSLEGLKRLFTADRLTVAITSTEPQRELAQSIVRTLEEYRTDGKKADTPPVCAPEPCQIAGTEEAMDALLAIHAERAERIRCSVPLNEKESLGLAIATDTAHAYVITNLSQAGEGAEYKGSYLTCNNLLNLTDLWEQIRVKGGAYGAGISTRFNTGGIVAHSYRDPSPAESTEILTRIPEMLREWAHRFEEGAPLDEFIISAIGATDGTSSPRSEGSSATLHAMCGIRNGKIVQRRRQIIDTTPADIRAAADTYEKAMSASVFAVAAPADKLQALPFLDRIITL